MRLLPLIVFGFGCAANGAPELSGVGDHVVVVGEELRIDLDATDPDGDHLSYGFAAPSDLPDLAERATVSVAPSGSGVFRWTPLASDLGGHAIDFTVSDGDADVVVTIAVDVVNSVTAPVFRAPLGSGATLDLDTKQCIELDVVIEDLDTTAVELAQQQPLVGATLERHDGTTATWRWCPSPEQRAVTRHTLVLAADDGENPPTIKNFVIVLRGGAPASPTCVDDAHENDDDPAHARATAFPSFSSTSNAICKDDDDWYRVELFTGEVMTVNLTFTQTNPQEDLDLHLIRNNVDRTPCDAANSDTCTVAHGQSADSNETTVVSAPAGCTAAPCEMFVVVRGFDGSAAPYAISIEIQ